jgi:hypothetical protein
VNISTGGAFVVLRDNVHIGTRIVLGMTSVGGTAYEHAASIAWALPTHEGYCYAGLQFDVPLDAAALADLTDVMPD